MSTKQKRAIFMIGVTAAVYAGIRYLLPLVLPFFISYGLARLIWPFVRKAKELVHLPETIGIVCGLLVTVAALLGLLTVLGGLAGKQLARLAGEMPQYVMRAERLLLEIADKIGLRLGMNEITVANEVQKRIQAASIQLQENLFPQLMSSLIPTAVRLGDWFAGAMVAVVASVFFIKERDVIKAWKERSIYRREIRVISKKLGRLGRAFFKTQGIIFLLVTIICVLGLWILGNQYFLLIGVGLGILDMLPVFGTGSVLVPWALIQILAGKWKMSAGLFVMYLLTYYLREFLEARMMGKELGLASLEMTIAMYAGLKLFGLWGLFLGPIGWILIKEIDKTLYIG